MPHINNIRIGTWNCKMGLKKKANRLEGLDLDIAVVQECSRGDWESLFGSGWYGDNPKKGIGICSPRGTYVFDQVDPDDISYRLVVPVTASGPVPLQLLAVWSFNHRQPGIKRSLAEAFSEYRLFSGNLPTVVLGDFNSSVVWDTPRKPNHQRAVDWLAGQGLASAYHSHFEIEQGSEPDPTLWLYHHQQRAYHIDYCFVPRQWLTSIVSVEIGSYGDWARVSDHAPLVVDLSLT